MDAVAVVFAHVEVGYYCCDKCVGDVVGGAPDFGGGCWGVGLWRDQYVYGEMGRGES